MRLFLYGSLLERNVLRRHGGSPPLPARLCPARLPGFARAPARGGRYQTLVPARSVAVAGMVVSVPADSRRRLSAYEGPEWRLTRVRPIGPRGPVPAYAFIAPAGARRPFPRRN